MERKGLSPRSPQESPQLQVAAGSGTEGGLGERGAGGEAADEVRRLWSRWGGGQGALPRVMVITPKCP